MEDYISTYHTPNEKGEIELKRQIKNYLPAGLEYVIIFQSTLEKVLSYGLNKAEAKVFMYVLSQVGFENDLTMPGLQTRCAKIIQEHQPNVSKALRKLEGYNIIIKEPIEFTRSYRYRINYELAAKDKGSEIKDKHENDKKTNPINVGNLFPE
jgi:DNA-binding MarR family transcriptional regulator